MKDMEVVYTNNLYRVLAVKKANKYLIINRITGIIEDEATKLPTAIGLAKAMHGALLKLFKEDEHEEQTP